MTCWNLHKGCKQCKRISSKFFKSSSLFPTSFRSSKQSHMPHLWRVELARLANNQEAETSAVGTMGKIYACGTPSSGLWEALFWSKIGLIAIKNFFWETCLKTLSLIPAACKKWRSAWYTLFAHAFNLSKMWGVQAIFWFFRVMWHQSSDLI